MAVAVFSEEPFLTHDSRHRFNGGSHDVVVRVLLRQRVP